MLRSFESQPSTPGFENKPKKKKKKRERQRKGKKGKEKSKREAELLALPAMQQKMRQERSEAWEREGLDPGSLLLR